MTRNGLAVLLLLTLFRSAAAAPVDSEPDPNQAAGSSSTQPAEPPAPIPPQRQEVTVEASLPYLPTSNTIASKLPLELAWTPANVGVVESLLFEHQGARVLSDALENVSGLNLQSGYGVFDDFVLRGFDALSSGLVLTDGAPEPEVSYYQLYNADRVEVFKGPAGFLYGSNPLSGAVNIVRKQPLPADFGSFAVAVGSFETYEGTVDYGASNGAGSLAFRLNGLWRDSAGYRDRIDSEASAINPAFTWRPDPRTSINVNLEYLRSDYRPDAGLPLVGGELAEVPRERSYASPFDRSEQDLLRFQVDLERRLRADWTLRNKLYLRTLDWDSDGTLLLGVLPNASGGLEVLRSLVRLEDRQAFFGNQLELIFSTKTGAIEHHVLAGLELERLGDDYQLDVALLPSIDLLDPVETAREPLFFLPDQSAAGDSRAWVVAPYLIDQLELGSALRVLLGARFDAIDFEDAVNAADRTHHEPSPLIGATYSPRPGLFLYANAGRSFAPPSPRVVGPLEPEAGRQIELGAHQELLDGRLRTTLAVFQLERDNIAIPDDNGFTQQAGDQRARGFELELGGELAPRLRGFLAYAYTDSVLTNFTERVVVGFFPPTAVTIDRSGNRSAFAPRHLLNLWFHREFDSGWSLGAGARYVSGQFIAEDNAFELDDYWRFDAAVGYGRDSWRWRVNLKNLTDADYELRGFGSAAITPAAPFALALALEVRP
jgi:TonB-dependent siderophore receptor